MPQKQRTSVRIDEDGKIQPRSKAEWLMQWLSDRFDLFSGGDVVITVERPKRTLGQNDFYWGYIIRPIRKALTEAGHPISEKALHNHYKELFLGVEKSYTYTDRSTGEVKEVTEPRSTTDLSSTQFDRYCERIRESELVRQLGVYLPRPDDPEEAFREIENGTVSYV